MSLRVVQWATGSVGVAAIKGVLEHPELELAGPWVHSDASCAAPPGIQTIFDLPLITGRAAPGLSR